MCLTNVNFRAASIVVAQKQVAEDTALVQIAKLDLLKSNMEMIKMG